MPKATQRASGRAGDGTQEFCPFSGTTGPRSPLPMYILHTHTAHVHTRPPHPTWPLCTANSSGGQGPGVPQERFNRGNLGNPEKGIQESIELSHNADSVQTLGPLPTQTSLLMSPWMASCSQFFGGWGYLKMNEAFCKTLGNI